MDYRIQVCDTRLKSKKGCGNCILSFDVRTVQEEEVLEVFNKQFPAPRYKVTMHKIEQTLGPLNGW